MRRIGLCCGNFDPIYKEMISLCEDILNEFGLDYILIAPYTMSSKPDDQLNSYIEHRKDMIRLATWGNNKIGLSEFDILDSSIRSRLDIKAKIEAKHNAVVYNIVSSQFFRELQSLDGYEDYLKESNVIVAVAPHFSNGVSQSASALSAKYNAHISFSTSSNAYMSSPLARAYVQLGVETEQHIPVSVLDYINKNFLYKTHSGLFERIRDLEPAPIYEHTVATCINAIEIAQMLNLSHDTAIITALLHNIGKCFTSREMRDQSVYIPERYYKTDMLSKHGTLGEIAAKYFMGVTDAKILNAIRYHSTGYPRMDKLVMLIFAAATLAQDHGSEDYKHRKYQFFNSPEKTFFQLLDAKYQRVRAEYPLSNFPHALRRAHSYYKEPSHLEGIFNNQK